MEKEMLKEIGKGLNKRERILLKIFAKTFIKIYNKVRVETVNRLI